MKDTEYELYSVAGKDTLRDLGIRDDSDQVHGSQS